MKKIMSQNETQANKESKIKKALAVFLITTCTSIAGHAGPISDGGSNTVNYRILTDYSINLQEAAGYQNFDKIVSSLKTKLPVLYRHIKKIEQESVFYIVPQKLKPLASEYVGLPFATEQSAINKIGTKEIFVDEVFYKKLTPVQRSHFFINEIVESLILSKNPNINPSKAMSDVRRTALGIINSQSDDSSSLQDKLSTIKLLPSHDIITPSEHDNILQDFNQYPAIAEYVIATWKNYCEQLAQANQSQKSILDDLLPTHINPNGVAAATLRNLAELMQKIKPIKLKLEYINSESTQPMLLSNSDIHWRIGEYNENTNRLNDKIYLSDNASFEDTKNTYSAELSKLLEFSLYQYVMLPVDSYDTLLQAKYSYKLDIIAYSFKRCGLVESDLLDTKSKINQTNKKIKAKDLLFLLNL